MEVRLVDRTFFAEVAETLGVSTLDVIGASPREDGTIIVAFTRGVEEAQDDQEAMLQLIAYGASLVREPSGILLVVGEPVETGTLADIVEEARRLAG